MHAGGGVNVGWYVAVGYRVFVGYKDGPLVTVTVGMGAVGVVSV